MDIEQTSNVIAGYIAVCMNAGHHVFARFIFVSLLFVYVYFIVDYFAFSFALKQHPLFCAHPTNSLQHKSTSISLSSPQTTFQFLSSNNRGKLNPARKYFSDFS